MKLDKEIFLKSNNIYLRAISEDDLDGNYSNWLNDSEITMFNSHGRFLMTIEKLKQFVINSRISDNILVLAVVDNSSNKHIGNISLQSINWIDRNAEIAFLLGEKDWWGKGVMFEAGQLVINHAFNTLNLHKVYCGTSSANLGMQKLAKKLGMIEEGLRKETLYKNGKYFDLIEYGKINYK